MTTLKKENMVESLDMEMNLSNDLGMYDSGFVVREINDEALYGRVRKVREIVNNSFEIVGKSRESQRSLRTNFLFKELKKCKFNGMFANDENVIWVFDGEMQPLGQTLRICNIVFIE